MSFVDLSRSRGRVQSDRHVEMFRGCGIGGRAVHLLTVLQPPAVALPDLCVCVWACACQWMNVCVCVFFSLVNIWISATILSCQSFARTKLVVCIMAGIFLSFEAIFLCVRYLNSFAHYFVHLRKKNMFVMISALRLGKRFDRRKGI